MPLDTIRMWTRFTPEKYAQLEKWADDQGMTMSQFVSICAWVGARQVMRMLEPEKFFTTEQWGQVIAAAVQHLPEDQRVEFSARIQEEAKQLQGANNEAAQVGGLLQES